MKLFFERKVASFELEAGEKLVLSFPKVVGSADQSGRPMKSTESNLYQEEAQSKLLDRGRAVLDVEVASFFLSYGGDPSPG